MLHINSEKDSQGHITEQLAQSFSANIGISKVSKVMC